VQVVNSELVERLAIPETMIEAVARQERDEVERQQVVFRRGRRPVPVEGRTVLLVDDGLATGSTMRAAVELLRRRGASRIVVAVPVGAADTCAELRRVADEVVCAASPRDFAAVGAWYADFTQTTDEEVASLLEEAGQWRHVGAERLDAHDGDRG
jgi:predicted phosphoribosyltransferase